MKEEKEEEQESCGNALEGGSGGGRKLGSILWVPLETASRLNRGFIVIQSKVLYVSISTRVLHRQLLI